MNKRYCVYSRKSKATEKGESIENQINACKDYIQRIDRAVDLQKDVDVYIDDGFSGKNTKRPEFQRMLAHIKKHQYAGLVCYRLDRISRNVCDFVTCINEFNKYGVSFMSVSEGFDTSTPMGRTMMYIASVFAEMERETIAERVRDNMHALAYTGRWLGGKTPYGFSSKRISYQSHNGATKYQSMLVPNEDEMRIVELVFSKYLEFGSYTALQKMLTNAGIRHRHGARFSGTAIKSLLRNPTYCCADQDAYAYFREHKALLPDNAESLFDGKHGILAFGRHNEYAALNPISEWIIAVGEHEGVIPGKTFVAVQNKVAENQLRYEDAFSYADNDYALLSGMVICKKCGGRMYTQRGASKAEDGYFAYICATRKTYGVNECDCRYLNGRSADAMVMNELLKYDVSNSRIRALLTEFVDKNSQHKKAQSLVEMYTRQIADKKAAINTLLGRLTSGDLNAVVLGYVNDQITQLDAEVHELEQQLKQESQNIVAEQNTQAIAEHIIEVLKDLRNKTSLESKREALREVIDHVEWDGDNLDVFYKWGAQA